MIRLFAVFAVLTLAACAPRGEIAALVAASAGSGSEHDIHVVTTRQKNAFPLIFGPERAGSPQYGRYRVSVPAERATGTIRWWRDGRPNPSRHFLTKEQAHWETPAPFEASLRKALADRPPAEREVVIFVHGYNVNFPEALYRLAQITEDFDAPAVPVLFSWPSAGDPRGYLYDRDSALLARDALAQTIRRVDKISAGRVMLVAHSMGGFLSVEALRQMAEGRDRDVIDRLDGLVLISPDIDVELFLRQAQEIAPLPQPTVVIASQRDAALRLSSLLRGREPRLGQVQDDPRLDAMGVQLLDVSPFGKDAQNGHLIGLTSPSLIKLLRTAASNEAAMAELLKAVDVPQ